jgi:hypothetical protein
MTRPFFQHTKVVRGTTKKELLDACLRYEANGWECIKPMHEVEEFGKRYDVRPISSTRGKSKYAFAGVRHIKEYRCVYKYKG